MVVTRGPMAERRSTLGKKMSVVEMLRIYKTFLQNVRIASQLIDNETQIVVILQPHNNISVWRTSKGK